MDLTEADGEVDDEVLEQEPSVLRVTKISRRLNGIASLLASLVGKYGRYTAREVRGPLERSERLFQYSWYISSFMQSNTSRAQAMAHFRSHWRERRVRPNPAFDPMFVAQGLLLDRTTDPLEFAERNPARVDHTCEWFSRQRYLQLHPDVAQSWVAAPELHFLLHGLAEGRQPNSDFTARRTSDSRTPSDSAIYRVVDRFEWEGNHFDIVHSQISPEIFAQIRDQSRHEIALLAPGVDAIPNLRKYLATDMLARNGLDAPTLIEKAGEGYDIVVFVPWIVIGGGDKYVSDMIQEIRARSGDSVLVVVSDSSETEARKREGHPGLAGFFSARLLFWRDIQLDRTKEVWYAALLMNRLQPRQIFVVNSNLGHAMLARYGRPLSMMARCFALYFSESPNATGAPYSARYFTEVCLNSYVVTDNEPMAAKLRERAAGLISDRILLLPPRVVVEPEQRFEARLRVRLGTWPPAWWNRCVWIARVEYFKGIDILLEIARQLPELTVDLFGSASSEMADLVASRPNLRYRGEFLSLDDLELESYGWLLFPSLFEGMPNAVLEAAQAALPVITTDVGGLRQTFDAQHLFFIPFASDVSGTAARFVEAIAALQRLGADELEVRIRAARAAAVAKHGPAAFSAAMARILQPGRGAL